LSAAAVPLAPPPSVPKCPPKTAPECPPARRPFVVWAGAAATLAGESAGALEVGDWSSG
jgi:hypothetical protein